MLDRRTFIKSGIACSGMASAVGVGTARGAVTGPCGVGGYDYRLPGLAKGSRLVFLGETITDMKWGRNERDRNHYLGHSRDS